MIDGDLEDIAETAREYDIDFVWEHRMIPVFEYPDRTFEWAVETRLVFEQDPTWID